MMYWQNLFVCFWYETLESIASNQNNAAERII
jgi:hypothetical protein